MATLSITCIFPIGTKINQQTKYDRTTRKNRTFQSGQQKS